MLDALYNAAEAMHRATTDFETVSHNLANVSTAGFRRIVNQHAETSAPDGDIQPVGVEQVDAVTFDLLQGPLVQSGNNLDIALNGPGFIELAGPAGPIFTRDGRLHVDQEGILTSISELPIEGEGGPITIPAGAAVVIDAQGAVFADNIQVGKISVKEPSDPDGVALAGDGVYTIADPVKSQDTIVFQGMHEGSNVSAVLELVRMIDAMRRYEAAQKTITSISEAVQQHTTSE